MLSTLRAALKVEEVRKKIIFTLLMFLVFRIGAHIPVPGIDNSIIQQLTSQAKILGFFDMVAGGAFSNFSIFAMSITPYINASIIMQLLTVIVPRLEQLAKEDRKKMAEYTRYLTVVLGLVQAIGLSFGFRSALVNPSFGSMALVALTLTAGTACLMWIGESITEKGIGNGISLLIFAGIISNFANQIAVGAYNVWFMPSYLLIALPILIISLVLIVAVTCVDLAERRVPVQYAKRVVGRKMYGGQSTHIPLKVNSSGVLPLIFASALMQFPPTILAMFGSSWWDQHINVMGFWYQLVFALLIIGFTFFYSSISFNPDEIAKNMQQNGGSIPGIRQGKPTALFIAKITKRINLFGALFLAVLSTIPTLIYGIANVSLPFQASSLLIAVSVALETTRQLESQILMRHYKGFLK